MKCPLCNLDGFIEKSKFKIEEDKLFIVQDVYCRNKNCPNCNKLIESVKKQQKVG